MILKPESIDDMCMYWKISREQRKTEIYNGLGIKGPQGYEDKGCYKCDGYKSQCNSYLTKNILKGK